MKLYLPPFVRKALARQHEEERIERITRRIRRSGGTYRHTHRTRPDGSQFTKPSLDARRQLRRRANRCARVARRFNRKES